MASAQKGESGNEVSASEAAAVRLRRRRKWLIGFVAVAVMAVAAVAIIARTVIGKSDPGEHGKKELYSGGLIPFSVDSEFDLKSVKKDVRQKRDKNRSAMEVIAEDGMSSNE